MDDLAEPGSLFKRARHRPDRIVGSSPGSCELRHPGRAGPRRSDLPLPAPQPANLVINRVEPLALNELHGVVADIALAADLEHRHDVGVMQSCRSAGFAAESLDHRLIGGDMPRKNLERHPAAERNLLGFVYDSHAAAADFTQDPVVADAAQGCVSRARSGALFLALHQAFGPLHLDHRREEVVNLRGKLRVAIGVLLERGVLAAPESVGEFLGQSIEQVVLFRRGDRHRLKPF